LRAAQTLFVLAPCGAAAPTPHVHLQRLGAQLAEGNGQGEVLTEGRLPEVGDGLRATGHGPSAGRWQQRRFYLPATSK